MKFLKYCHHILLDHLPTFLEKEKKKKKSIEKPSGPGARDFEDLETSVRAKRI
jgi:hypothetical protein